MKSYVWLAFVFMGWGYYEMSGGADFVPEQRELAQIEAPETVTRAQSTTLLTVSTSNVVIEPDVSNAELTEVATQATALDTIEAEVVEIAAPVIEDKLNIRAVGTSRVNMRMGPGTGFDVITTLDSGTKLEVLDVNPDGWANVSTVNNGLEGWMAARLLTDPET